MCALPISSSLRSSFGCILTHSWFFARWIWTCVTGALGSRSLYKTSSQKTKNFWFPRMARGSQSLQASNAAKHQVTKTRSANITSTCHRIFVFPTSTNLEQAQNKPTQLSSDILHSLLGDQSHTKGSKCKRANSVPSLFVFCVNVASPF